MPNDLALAPPTAPHPDVPVTLQEIQIARACAAMLVEADAEVARLERELALAKQHREYVATVDVPAAFGDAQFESVVLPDGTTVQIERRLHCSITKGEKPTVLQWLKQRHHTKILTCTVSVDFARDEYGLAQEVMADLAACLVERGKARALREEWDVPSSTLKAFVGQFFKAGNVAELPKGLNWFNDNVAVVVRPPAPAPAPETNPLA